MRVLVTGGGTGGHVNPALAIANTIKENIPDAEIAFVGTVRGLENELVPKAGYRLYHVDVRGIRRSLSLYNIRSLWLAAISPVKAKKVIKEFKPDLVVGTGGYVSWPILVAASRMNIPTAVHESNAVPGLAVRRLVPYVDRIFTNFAVSAEMLGKCGKVMQVGCPMLGQFGNISRDEARDRLGISRESKYVVSFGGSLGAAAMNEMALELMRDYVSAHPDVRYTHATGGDHYETVKERFDAEGLGQYENIELLQYIYDMPLRMAAADLVISRAGAITISELARQGKAAILIPSPNVTDDQQTKNARALADIGGACMIREPELEGGRITKAVASLLDDVERREAMEKAIAGFAPLDSNKLIFDELMRLAGKQKV